MVITGLVLRRAVGNTSVSIMKSSSVLRPCLIIQLASTKKKVRNKTSRARTQNSPIRLSTPPQGDGFPTRPRRSRALMTSEHSTASVCSVRNSHVSRCRHAWKATMLPPPAWSAPTPGGGGVVAYDGSVILYFFFSFRCRSSPRLYSRRGRSRFVPAPLGIFFFSAGSDVRRAAVDLAPNPHWAVSSPGETQGEVLRRLTGLLFLFRNPLSSGNQAMVSSVSVSWRLRRGVEVGTAWPYTWTAARVRRKERRISRGGGISSAGRGSGLR